MTAEDRPPDQPFMTFPWKPGATADEPEPEPAEPSYPRRGGRRYSPLEPPTDTDPQEQL